MKQFLITFAAVLIGGCLALLGYDHFIVQPREAQQQTAQWQRQLQAQAAVSQAVASQATVAQPDMAKARADAQQVAAEVEASVQRSVDGARDTMNAQAKEMDRRGLLADAVSRATMFKVSLTEFYQSNGQWPHDADEAGLPAPGEMRGGAVRTITLGAKGVVTVALDDRFAANSAIVLRPLVNAKSQMVEWLCEIKGDPALKQTLSHCKSE